jgi:hypothetical protein
VRLTPALKIKIVEAARDTKDLDAVEAATGVSSTLLNEWLQRGARKKSAIHKELLDEIKPFLEEMYKRSALAIPVRFFEQLALMMKHDKEFEKIATVWFNSMWLNDPKVSERQRLEMARQIAKIFYHPIHKDRFKFVKDELQRELDHRARTKGRSPESEMADSTVNAAFVAADKLKSEEPEYLPPVLDQISDAFHNMQKFIGDSVIEDLVGPEWRKRFKEKPKDDKAPKTDAERHPSAEQALRMAEKLQQINDRREFIYRRLALLSKKTLAQVQAIIQKHDISTIRVLAEKLRVERTDLYRNVILPARELKPKSR